MAAMANQAAAKRISVSHAAVSCEARTCRSQARAPAGEKEDQRHGQDDGLFEEPDEVALQVEFDDARRVDRDGDEGGVHVCFFWGGCWTMALLAA